jgi:sugar lactone lactonase YvrE
VTFNLRLSHFLVAIACLLQALLAGQAGQAQSVSPAINFGSVNIGTASAPTAVTLTFTTTGPLGNILVLTQGASGLDFANAGAGPCAVNNSGNGSCTINVTFTPRFAGTRYGAVVLEDTSGNVVASTYLEGTGTGPQVNFSPGTETTVPTSVLSFPSSIALDGNEAIYIADTDNNRILKETPSAGTYTETVVPSSALSNPSGIAIDGAGNLYIADTGNNRILKETATGTGYVESTVSTSALAAPAGVAVDVNGNIYIADTNNNRILIESVSSGAYSESTIPTSALASPFAVAVDTSGNVYIVDSGNNRILIETLSSGTYSESILPTSSLAYPLGVAVDGSANIYIADTFNQRVLKETLSSGNYVESVLPTGIIIPGGVEVAGSGNVYIADIYNSRLLKEDYIDPPALSFAPTAPGATSSDSPQTVTVKNVGNADLNLPVPSGGSNPSIAPNFTLDSSGSSACPLVTIGPSAGTLSAGMSCQLPLSFTPTMAGIFSGSLVLTDTTLNAPAPGYAVQTIPLNGIGTGSTQQSITFGPISSQVANSSLSLTAAASSGLPVSFVSTTLSACTVNGSTASLLTAGTCTIQASQAGNSLYAAAPVITQSFTVTLAPQIITFNPIATQFINTSASVALTATVNSGLPISYTSETPGVCTVSLSSASLLATGTCTIQASQSGDGVVFAAAASVTQSFTVQSANTQTGTNFASTNIGSTSSPVAVTLTIGSAATLGSISVLTQGASGLDFANSGSGTCSTGTSYSVNGTCTVNVTFTPTLPGTRLGAVLLKDGSGNVISTAYLQGIGVGPEVNFLPGTESIVSTSALAYPSAVAVDGNGNIYIADTGNNRLLKETLTSGSYTESTISTSALSSPSAVAVDGGGSLYVADSGNDRILKETPFSGGYVESTVPTSTLANPSALAVDGSGNVYIADTYNNRILVESLVSGSYSESSIPNGAWSPDGIAVDGHGNVYIADYGNNRVLVETLSSGNYAEGVLQTSTMAGPSAMVVDGGGNVYIVDAGNNRVLKETLSSGSYVESTIQTSTLSFPYGLAVAGNGNVFLADTYNGRILKEDFADPPSLSFFATPENSTSSDSPQTVTIQNVGNGTLTFPIPSSGTNPSVTANFSLSSSGTSLCPQISAGAGSAGTLASGQSCLLPIDFVPTSTGRLTGSVGVTGDSLNQTQTQSIALTGTGTGTTLQTISFAAIPAQNAGATLILSATASSGLPVSFTSITPAICSISGSTVSLTSAGTCTVKASQNGNSVYAPARAVTQSFAVSTLPQTITFTPIAPQVINTSVSITLTASATSGLPVNFVSLTPSVCTAGGSAAMLVTIGTCTIQANQDGNGVYAPALPVTQSFAVESANTQSGTNFGSINIGSPSSPLAIILNFSAAATLGDVSVVTKGSNGLDFANSGSGSCAIGTSYAANASCTVSVVFTPTLAGARLGAVALEDDAGNGIATAYLQGTGIGPEVNFLPGAESVVPSSALVYPSAAAVDGVGNVYIADTGNNRILKETPSGAGYSEITITTGALASPSGVAVDGSGNLYIADTADNRVLKESLSEGNYTESVVPTSSLSYPVAVAVDGSGNLYIADSGNGRILKEAFSSGCYTETTVPTSELLYPSAVAVDGNGTVYVADTYDSRILVETLSAGSYTESTLPTSALSFPFGIAVDGNGNIYIADTYNQRILKEIPSNGSFVESATSTGALDTPYDLAVADNGNVYIADTYNNRILEEDLADPPILNFVPTTPGTTSSDSPQTFTVENVGNRVLMFSVPSSGNNPSIATNFSLNSNGGSACPLVSAGSSSAGTLGVGQTCVLPISFLPTAAGDYSGSLMLTDNALNASSVQNIQLNGTGTGSAQQSITFDTISSQTVNSKVVLSATATSGLPVTFASATLATCTVAGSVAFLIAGGTCSVQANQGGSATYAAANPVTQNFTVNLLAQTITFAAIPAQVVNTNAPAALSATASSNLPVSFASATPSICTVSNATAQATLLAPGTCTVEASQAGDGIIYAAAPSVDQSFSVSAVNLATGANLGSINIGSSNSAMPATVTLNTAATLASIAVTTQGAAGLDFTNAGTGSCATGTSYNTGDTCTVGVTFTPTVSGTRYGAITLEDGSGNVIATSYFHGIGIGPQLTFVPGTEINLPTSAFPAGIAVDGGGNIYVVDEFNARVLKETVSSSGYTESIVSTSSLFDPSAIAVDGAGNLYIADAGNGRILKETPSAGSYVETVVPTSTLNYASGVAVDGGGNVYVSDSNNNRVLIERLVAGNYTESVIPASTHGPSGIAVDESGDIYLVDGGNKVLIESLSSGSYTESTIPSNATGITTVAVDGNDNIYISAGNEVLKESRAENTYVESTVVAAAQLSPNGIAVDGSGNIYIAGGQGLLKEDLADPPNLSFALTAPGSTSSDSPRMMTVINDGNAPLNFTVPSNGQNPSIASNFSLNSSGTSSCPIVSATSTAATLVTGQSCLLSISFNPPTAGTFSGALILTDDTLNASAPAYRSQTIQLSGTGLGSTPQTITFGTISAQSANSSLTLSATASSGLEVTFSSMTPSVCTVAETTASLIEAGTCTVQANQSGNGTYAAATPVMQSFTVNLLSQAAPDFPPIPDQIANTTVPFNVLVYGSAVLTSTTPSVCTMSGPFTAMLIGLGTCTLQAYYPGDGVVSLPSPTVTQSFNVVPFNLPTGANLGTVNIGSSSSADPVALSFSVAGTLSAISIVTQATAGLDFSDSGGGTCTVGTTYNAGDTCTVNVKFRPSLAGTRYGAVTLADGSGNVLASTYVRGLGVGPQVSFLPGREIAVSTGSIMNFPYGIAVDGSGNIYIADTGNDRILKETPSSNGYTESVVPTSSLYWPYGVAVDSAGNVYISDRFNERILKETLGPSGYTESTVCTFPFSAPDAIAVDGGGNVYAWDPYQRSLVVETLASGTYTQAVVPTSSVGPEGIAVDASGNIYLVDTWNSRILKETYSAGRYTESVVPTSVSAPFGIAIDGSGNLYISDNGIDAGNSRIFKETLYSGRYVESVLHTSTLKTPFALAVDGLENVYIADSGNNRILKEDFADPPSLSFASTTEGTTSTDSPQFVTVENIGNATLNFPAPASGTNPGATASFTIGNHQESLCPVVSSGSPTSGALPAGHSCTLPINFSATATGTLTGSVALTDNALNAIAPGYATQTIVLSGTGVAPPASSTVSSQFNGVESPLSEDGMWSMTGSWASLSENDGVYSTTTTAAARLVSPAIGPDQFAEITYDQDPGNESWVGVMTRIQGPTNGSCYLAIAFAGEVQLYRTDDNGGLSFTGLATANVDVSVAPRLLRLESRGATHRVYFNGTLLIAYTDPNNVYTSGQPGIAAAVFGGPTVKILSFTGGALTGSNNTVPPLRMSGAPADILSPGTSSATLSLTTDEAATCRYALSAGISFGSMANTFSTTGGTSHSRTVMGLQDGGVYAYYVRCQDRSGNVNTDDYTITFSIATSSGTVSSHFIGVGSSLSDGGMWSTAGSWAGLSENNGAYSTNVTSGARLTTPAIGPDQFAEITYDQDPGSASWVGAMTRVQSATNGSGYLAIAYAGQVRLYRTDDSGGLSFPLLASADVDVSVAPRLLRLESQGSTHRVYFNGTLLITYTDPNNVYTSGQPGIAAAVFGGPTMKILSFTGGTLGDTTPPILTAGQPTGVLPSGTTSTTLGLTTGEAATCRYATSSGVAYGSMTNTFSTTGGISQATSVTGLQNGSTYNYYVRCQDSAGNVDTNDYLITFSVGN